MESRRNDHIDRRPKLWSHHRDAFLKSVLIPEGSFSLGSNYSALKTIFFEGYLIVTAGEGQNRWNSRCSFPSAQKVSHNHILESFVYQQTCAGGL
jgi:hypothetical protein